MKRKDPILALMDSVIDGLPKSDRDSLRQTIDDLRQWVNERGTAGAAAVQYVSIEKAS